MEIKGDGMSPLINKNDLVMMDTSYKLFDVEGVFVISYSEEYFVKRIIPINKSKIMAVSENKDYPPVEYQKKIDKIFWKGHMDWEINMKLRWQNSVIIF